MKKTLLEYLLQAIKETPEFIAHVKEDNTSINELESSDYTNGEIIARLELNRELRTGKPSKYRGDKLVPIDKMKKELDRSVAVAVDKDTVFYRGISRAWFRNAKIGTEFTDPGFLFISSDRKLAKKYGEVVMVKVPKGTKLITGLTDQSEFILPRNTKFIKDTNSSIKIL